MCSLFNASFPCLIGLMRWRLYHAMNTLCSCQGSYRQPFTSWPCGLCRAVRFRHLQLNPKQKKEQSFSSIFCFTGYKIENAPFALMPCKIRDWCGYLVFHVDRCVNGYRREKLFFGGNIENFLFDYANIFSTNFVVHFGYTAFLNQRFLNPAKVFV